MAVEGKYLVEGSVWLANSDLSAKQFCAVKIVGSGLVDLAATGGEAIAGILENTPAAGDAPVVAFVGFPKALAGASGFTAGDKLVTEAATGQLTTYVGSGTVVAVAVTTAAANCPGCIRLLATAG